MSKQVAIGALVFLVLSCAARGSSLPTPAAASESIPPSTPRDFYNAGTDKLRKGKLREAEAFLQSALASQIDKLQPPALYNLGHVRFDLGGQELKKGPSARPTAARGRAAAESADQAIREADEALAGNDTQKLVEAYLHGRGVRRELREATKAVRRAMETCGSALSKWQRASGDFKSSAELNSSDPDARQNAETVDRSIAKLIDSIRELEQAAGAIGQKKEELGDKMKSLKGRIPEENMPPGAAGDDEEDEDQPMGPKPGEKEGATKEGQEMTLSPEQAGWLLEGFKLDADHRLPMGQKDSAEPKTPSRKTW